MPPLLTEYLWMKKTKSTKKFKPKPFEPLTLKDLPTSLHQFNSEGFRKAGGKK